MAKEEFPRKTNTSPASSKDRKRSPKGTGCSITSSLEMCSGNPFFSNTKIVWGHTVNPNQRPELSCMHSTASSACTLKLPRNETIMLARGKGRINFTHIGNAVRAKFAVGRLSQVKKHASVHDCGDLFCHLGHFVVVTVVLWLLV